MDLMTVKNMYITWTVKRSGGFGGTGRVGE